MNLKAFFGKINKINNLSRVIKHIQREKKIIINKNKRGDLTTDPTNTKK